VSRSSYILLLGCDGIFGVVVELDDVDKIVPSSKPRRDAVLRGAFYLRYDFERLKRG
jgi:hypothetical protein